MGHEIDGVAVRVSQQRRHPTISNREGFLLQLKALRTSLRSQLEDGSTAKAQDIFRMSDVEPDAAIAVPQHDNAPIASLPATR
jgi:hypothetical protein